MAKRSQKTDKGPDTGKRAAAPVTNHQAVKAAEDDWNEMDDTDSDNEWMEVPVREKDSSRIRRQMEARRKLEQMMEAKRLSRLLEDWVFPEEGYLSEERS